MDDGLLGEMTLAAAAAKDAGFKRVEVAPADVLAMGEEIARLRANVDAHRERSADSEDYDRHLRREVIRLLRQQADDRAAVRALVEALPKCDTRECDRAATTELWRDFEDNTVRCDGCRFETSGDLPYAAPFRALLERMAAWKEVE